jgi:hypothetical protein
MTDRLTDERVAEWREAVAKKPVKSGDICLARVPDPEGGRQECSQTIPCEVHGDRYSSKADREREILEWDMSARSTPGHCPEGIQFYSVTDQEIRQAVALMRSAPQPPPAAGDAEVDAWLNRAEELAVDWKVAGSVRCDGQWYLLIDHLRAHPSRRARVEVPALVNGVPASLVADAERITRAGEAAYGPIAVRVSRALLSLAGQGGNDGK